ncbi:hypothetical protein KAR91_44505 [Candidatus Pacearchaeota archaeon]|nr:hypothetical protein [Candidatus Pacearchaeota archaeon]
MAWADIQATSVEPRGKHKYTLTVLDTQSEITEAINQYIRGTITQLLFVVPDLEGGGTATLSIIDEDGEEMYTSGALAESTTHKLTPNLDVTGRETFKIVTDVVQTADKAHTVKPWYKAWA